MCVRNQRRGRNYPQSSLVATILLPIGRPAHIEQRIKPRIKRYSSCRFPKGVYKHISSVGARRLTRLVGTNLSGCKRHTRHFVLCSLITSVKVTFAFSWISWIIIHEIHVIHEIQTEDFTSTLYICLDYNPTKVKLVDYNPA